MISAQVFGLREARFFRAGRARHHLPGAWGLAFAELVLTDSKHQSDSSSC